MSLFSVTQHLDEIAVFERHTDQFQFANPDIRIVRGEVAAVDPARKILAFAGSRTVKLLLQHVVN